MKECLRCSNRAVGDSAFCDVCQCSLLHRSQREQEQLPSSYPQEHTKLLVQEEAGQYSSQKLPKRFTWFVDCRSSMTRWLRKQPRTEPLSMDVQRQLLLRRTFFILVALAIVVLIFDSILVSMVFTRRHLQAKPVSGHPTLTFSPNQVVPGQVATLRLRHFPASARVLLTRDIAEAIHMDTSSPLISLNDQGAADIRILIDENWETGVHYIQAEDIIARYTASTSVKVLGNTPIQPPRLMIKQSIFNLGKGYVGASTLQTIELHNEGNGEVAWFAKSNQPWLLLTPTQGLFRKSQRIVLAVNRSDLSAGDYEGSILFQANGGNTVRVQIKMTVQALPTDPGAVMAVSSPVMQFSTADSGADPKAQTMSIYNPGTQPLYWSFGDASATISVDQKMPFLANMDWLDVQPKSGVIAPKGKIQVQVRVKSKSLLPGVYSGMALFSATNHALNVPQSVAFVLIVQPRCRVITSHADMSFVVHAGQTTNTVQPLNITTTPGCAGTLRWQVYAMDEWLQVMSEEGTIEPNKSSSIRVSIQTEKLRPGLYQGTIVLKSERHTQTIQVQLSLHNATAVPSSTQPVPSSTQAVVSTSEAESNSEAQSKVSEPSVTATVGTEQPCTLEVSPAQLKFFASFLDSTPAGQAITVKTVGSCRYPLTWTATVDARNQSWIYLSKDGGRESGNGDILIVNVNSDEFLLGTYQGNILFTVTDAGGKVLRGNTQNVLVTLSVVG